MGCALSLIGWGVISQMMWGALSQIGWGVINQMMWGALSQVSGVPSAR